MPDPIAPPAPPSLPERRPWLRFGPPDRNRGGATIAWFAIGGLLAVLSLAWGTLQGLGAIAHAERTEERTVPAAGVGGLVVRSDAGRVDLVTGDDDEIVVDAKVRDGLVATDLDIRVVDGVLRVDAGCSWLTGPWCKVDLRIAVPADLAVDVRTDTGRITATDLGGQLRLSSETGTIRATGLRSTEVDARSDASEVRLRFATAPRRVEAVSDAGRVEVAVPLDDAYRVDARSDAGRAQVAVRTDPVSDRTITAVSGARSVVVRYLEAGEG
jgi:hypothetical protein